MKTLIIFLAIVAILAIAIVLMAVKIIFVKGGKFPSSHVHDNPELQKRNIHCASSDPEL